MPLHSFFRSKNWHRALAACLLLACMGCSTIITRLTGPDWRPPDPPLPRIYSGTLFNFQCLFKPAMRDTQGLGVLCLVDVPFSLVADTVMLPFSIYGQIRYGDYASEKPAPKKTNVPIPGAPAGHPAGGSS